MADDYVDPKFKKQMFRYLDMAKNKKEFFFEEQRPLQVLCAYGRANQDIESAVQSIAFKIGYKTKQVDIPQYLTEDNIITVYREIQHILPVFKHTCLVINNFQNSVRTQHSVGLHYGFINYLKELAIEDDRLMIVICINGHPGVLPQEIIKKLHVRCLFRPPETNEREKIFRSFMSAIKEHIKKNKTVFEWISWMVPDSFYSDLADYSKSATSGQIRSFVREVYQQMLISSYACSKEKPLKVDEEFIQKFLQYDGSGTQTIDDTLSPEADKKYLEFAGETTTVEDVGNARAENEIFKASQKNKQRESTLETKGKRQKMTKD